MIELCNYDLIEAIGKLILSNRSQSIGTYIVGVNGAPTSGKTTLSSGLQKWFLNKSVSAKIIHIDDFTPEKKVRYSGNDEYMNFYKRGIDLDLFFDEIILPLRRNGQLNVTLRHLDIESDKYVRCVEYDVDKKDILIVEGVFIFKPKIRQFFDFTIYLAIKPETGLERSTARYNYFDAEEAKRRMVEKYIKGHCVYLAKYQPYKLTDIVILNDSEESQIISGVNSDLEMQFLSMVRI